MSWKGVHDAWPFVRVWFKVSHLGQEVLDATVNILAKTTSN